MQIPVCRDDLNSLRKSLFTFRLAILCLLPLSLFLESIDEGRKVLIMEPKRVRGWWKRMPWE